MVKTTTRNEPKDPNHWEQECAHCDRPLARYYEGATANYLWRLGYTQESDGTWLCASCSRSRTER